MIVAVVATACIIRMARVTDTAIPRMTPSTPRTILSTRPMTLSTRRMTPSVRRTVVAITRMIQFPVAVAT